MTIHKHSLVRACACLVFLATSIQGMVVNYDGQWWRSIDERQRRGFLYGFEACYFHLVDHNSFRENVSIQDVNEYLRTHPASLAEPVEATLLKISSQLDAQPARKPLEGNESPKELKAKWGAHNDGDDWRGPDSWHLGWVEGFLECYSKHTKSKYGTFSKPPEWYVNAIANWYGTKADDDQALDETRAREKIPEVLFRFRDRPGK